MFRLAKKKQSNKLDNLKLRLKTLLEQVASLPFEERDEKDNIVTKGFTEDEFRKSYPIQELNKRNDDFRSLHFILKEIILIKENIFEEMKNGYAKKNKDGTFDLISEEEYLDFFFILFPIDRDLLSRCANKLKRISLTYSDTLNLKGACLISLLSSTAGKIEEIDQKSVQTPNNRVEKFCSILKKTTQEILEPKIYKINVTEIKNIALAVSNSENNVKLFQLYKAVAEAKSIEAAIFALTQLDEYIATHRKIKDDDAFDQILKNLSFGHLDLLNRNINHYLEAIELALKKGHSNNSLSFLRRGLHYFEVLSNGDYTYSAKELHLNKKPNGAIIQDAYKAIAFIHDDLIPNTPQRRKIEASIEDIRNYADRAYKKHDKYKITEQFVNDLQEKTNNYFSSVNKSENALRIFRDESSDLLPAQNDQSLNFFREKNKGYLANSIKRLRQYILHMIPCSAAKKRLKTDALGKPILFAKTKTTTTQDKANVAVGLIQKITPYSCGKK